jgi:hypothetical protein
MGCAPCMVTLDLRQSGPAVSNDHHRARSMVHAMLTDRAKKRLGKTALAARAQPRPLARGFAGFGQADPHGTSRMTGYHQVDPGRSPGSRGRSLLYRRQPRAVESTCISR